MKDVIEAILGPGFVAVLIYIKISSMARILEREPLVKPGRFQTLFENTHNRR